MEFHGPGCIYQNPQQAITELRVAAFLFDVALSSLPRSLYKTNNKCRYIATDIVYLELNILNMI